MVNIDVLIDAFQTCAINKKTLVESTDFIFAKAQEVLTKYESIVATNAELHNIINMSYEEFKASNDPKVSALREAIFDFVAYCDKNGAEKEQRNKYEDKRTIASCQIRQNIWVKHLLKYKKQDADTNDSVLNMIHYVKDPEHFYPIVSEPHKKSLIEKVCGKTYNQKTFEEDLTAFLEQFGNPCRCKSNDTDFKMVALYDVADLWMEKSDSSESKGGNNVWLWMGDYDTLTLDCLCAGETVHPNLKDFGQFVKYEELRDAYQKAKGNTDVSIPDAYWKFIKSVKPGDYVVIFSNARAFNKNTHMMYGWGCFTSEIIFDIEAKSPMKRTVQWLGKCEPAVQDMMTNNSLFFHGTTTKQADNIKKLLNIEETKLEQGIMASDKILNLLKQKKQIILQGAPGTGKTYATASLAVALCNGCDTQNMSREEIMKQYKELQRLGRIGFTTFHQSMDYEEFVEGIKPVKEDDGTINYDVKDGLFKRICQKASRIETSEALVSGNLTPTIWKVSLQGTGDNPTRTDCMKNNRIRIGWDDYGSEINDATQFDEGGKIVLDAFINKMKIGDYVLSCYSASTIDAIGIVTGDYEWLEDVDEYRRSRKVKWLITGIKEDIVELNNNKTMTLSSVYKLNSMTNDKLKVLLDKYQNTSLVKKSTQESKPYLLIIDEINRGNISKIFGELITLLEADKRLGKLNEVSVSLPYSEVEFGVPDNLFIIGTMNTADRSVGYIDYAIRRRFAFVTLKSDREIITNYYSDPVLQSFALSAFDKIQHLMQERISSDFELDDIMIGHSYFLAKSKGELLNKLEYEVFPLIHEYIHDGLLNVGQNDEDLNEILDLIS